MSKAFQNKDMLSVKISFAGVRRSLMHKMKTKGYI
mgnify:CR=1 FL=1